MESFTSLFWCINASVPYAYNTVRPVGSEKLLGGHVMGLFKVCLGKILGIIVNVFVDIFKKKYF